DEHHAVFRMIDDPADLVLEQPRIDGVVHRAHSEDAVPAFQVPPGVPGHGGDAVALLDAIALQTLRHLQRAGADLRVIAGGDWPLDGARDHGAVAMLDGGVIDDAMAQEWPILHQAKHGQSSGLLLGQLWPGSRISVKPGEPEAADARSAGIWQAFSVRS